METEKIKERLTGIFREVFKNENIELNNETTTADIDNWDSLNHMIMIHAVEVEFSIKFKLKELNKLRNVGVLIELIHTKTS